MLTDFRKRIRNTDFQSPMLHFIKSTFPDGAHAFRNDDRVAICTAKARKGICCNFHGVLRQGVIACQIIGGGEANQGFHGIVCKDHAALGIEGLLLGIHSEVAQFCAVLESTALDGYHGQIVVGCRNMGSIGVCIIAHDFVAGTISSELILQLGQIPRGRNHAAGRLTIVGCGGNDRRTLLQHGYLAPFVHMNDVRLGTFPCDTATSAIGRNLHKKSAVLTNLKLHLCFQNTICVRNRHGGRFLVLF